MKRYVCGGRKEVNNSASWSHGRGSPLLSGVVLEAMGGPKAARDSRIPGSGSEFRGVEAKSVRDGDVRGLKLAGDFWAWRIGWNGCLALMGERALCFELVVAVLIDFRV